MLQFVLVWFGLVSLLHDRNFVPVSLSSGFFILEPKMKKLIGSRAARKGVAILSFTVKISCALAICGVIPQSLSSYCAHFT